MIRILAEFDSFREFIDEINADPDYLEPMLQTEEQFQANLFDALKYPDQIPLGVYSGDRITGLFVFQIINDERYIEMLVGLSRDPGAYGEIADWLRTRYPGYQADFVFNPKNRAIRAVLDKLGARFYPEEIKMTLAGDHAPVDQTGIEPLSEAFREQYVAMHGTDVYWTGDKVAEASDKFRVFLAVEKGSVVGYIDVTKDYGENEIYDLLVREGYRRRGWGRKLLARAIEANRPKGMMLIVEAGNEPAKALYRSMGFSVDPKAASQLATWRIG